MNTFIDFDIIKNSDKDKLKQEFAIMIANGMKIYAWHSNIDPVEMAVWAQTNDLLDFIWNFYKKDSFHYSKVDVIIDSDEKLVNKFKARGIHGNVLTSI